jgi:hypothetical protein
MARHVPCSLPGCVSWAMAGHVPCAIARHVPCAMPRIWIWKFDPDNHSFESSNPMTGISCGSGIKNHQNISYYLISTANVEKLVVSWGDTYNSFPFKNFDNFPLLKVLVSNM